MVTATRVDDPRWWAWSRIPDRAWLWQMQLFKYSFLNVPPLMWVGTLTCWWNPAISRDVLKALVLMAEMLKSYSVFGVRPSILREVKAPLMLEIVCQWCSSSIWIVATNNYIMLVSPSPFEQRFTHNGNARWRCTGLTYQNVNMLKRAFRSSTRYCLRINLQN